VLLGELAERRGVEVEALDADPDLVGPQVAARVEALSGLRQRSGGRDHPMGAHRIGCGSHVGHEDPSQIVAT